MESLNNIVILSEKDLRRCEKDSSKLTNFNINIKQMHYASHIIYIGDNGDMKVLKSRTNNMPSKIENIYNLLLLKNKIRKINGEYGINIPSKMKELLGL